MGGRGHSKGYVRGYGQLASGGRASVDVSARRVAGGVHGLGPMEIISSEQAPAAVGPYSQAIRSGHLLFCAGMLPLNPATMKIEAVEIRGQTEQVLANLSALLAAAGATFANVVKATVFMKDLGDFAAMNELYAAAFGSHKPARSTVQVAKLPLDSLVEIEVIAELS